LTNETGTPNGLAVEREEHVPERGQWLSPGRRRAVIVTLACTCLFVIYRLRGDPVEVARAAQWATDKAAQSYAAIAGKREDSVAMAAPSSTTSAVSRPVKPVVPPSAPAPGQPTIRPPADSTLPSTARKSAGMDELCAADAVAQGNEELALELYGSLATADPGQKAFKEARDILKRKIQSRRDVVPR
jgi:hypothetical protein